MTTTVLLNPPVRRVETAGERWTHDDFMRLAPEDRKEGIIQSVALPDFRLKTAWLWPDEAGNLPNPLDVLRELGAV